MAIPYTDETFHQIIHDRLHAHGVQWGHTRPHFAVWLSHILMRHSTRSYWINCVFGLAEHPKTRDVQWGLSRPHSAVWLSHILMRNSTRSGTINCSIRPGAGNPNNSPNVPTGSLPFGIMPPGTSRHLAVPRRGTQEQSGVHLRRTRNWSHHLSCMQQRVPQEANTTCTKHRQQTPGAYGLVSSPHMSQA